MLHAVIMAGGSGTRLWPESRVRRPKQLLRIQGDRTMIQATVDRLGQLVPLDRVLIATTADLAGPIQEHLSHLPRGAILAEPCARNTAPCIGLAALRVLRDDPDAVMAIMPADQVIAPDEVFQQSLRLAASLVEEKADRLVTFGIRPTYPSTGFGYIERGAALEPSANSAARPGVFQVAQFHEKPNLEVASRYLAAGTYYWNSGIFLWRAQTILDALARFQPQLYSHLERIGEAAAAPNCAEVLHREFAAMPKISIDYAVMEKADQVVVVEAPYAWDDVGSWLALERHRARDASGNLLEAPRVLAVNTRNTTVRAADASQAVVVAGLDHVVVVVTPDAILVADKRDEASIAAVNAQLRERGWNDLL